MESLVNRLPFIKPTKTYNIVVVGDCPKIAEVMAGEAFVSSASVFFKQTLALIVDQFNEINGTNYNAKEDVFYTYATLESYSKSPNMEQINKEKNRLAATLKEAKPDIIITLGDAAMKAVANTRAGVLSSRGKWKWDANYNAYIISTMHPSYVLANTTTFITWIQDIQKALRFLIVEKGKSSKPKIVVTYILTDVDKTNKFLRWLRSGDTRRLVASDIETRGFNFRKHAMLCAGFSVDSSSGYVICEEMINHPDVQEELRLTIESDNITWIYHNGKFDNKFYWAQKNMKARTDIDTMLMHYCLDVRKGTHDLEQVAIEYLGIEPYEHEAHKYVKESFADIPRPILYKYQSYDTAYTFGIYEYMLPLFEEERKLGRKIDTMFNLMMDASNNYMRVELNGAKVDEAHVEKLKVEYLPRLEESFATLGELAIKSGWDATEYARWADENKLAEWRKTVAKTGKKMPGPTKEPKAFNPNSYMHIRFMLFHVWGLTPIIVKKKVSSNADSLKIYKERLTNIDAIRFIDAKLSYAKDKKMYSTYIDGIAKITDPLTGRVHTTFKLHGTETGRLSSAEPNFHNIPRQKDIKNIITSRPGKILMQGDYSQAELRVLAVEGGDPWLINVYTSGSDLHDQISVQLYGENFTKEQRVRAKAVNFGIPYGRSAYTLAAEHGMSLSEAKQLIKDWFAPQPLTEKWMNDRRSDPIKGNIFETPTGRVRPFGLVTENNKNGLQNEAVNFPIQSEASDCMVWSVCRLQEEIDKINEELDGQEILIINTVHDSVIFELDNDDELIMRLYKLCESILPQAAKVLLDTDVPFVADYEIGFSWGSLSDLVIEDDVPKTYRYNKAGEQELCNVSELIRQ